MYDEESGERDRRGEAESPEKEITRENQTEKAKNEFAKSLRKIFTDVGRVEEIMRDITIWENGR